MSKRRSFKQRVRRAVIRTLANNVDAMTSDDVSCVVRWATPAEVKEALTSLNKAGKVIANIVEIGISEVNGLASNFEIKRVTWEIRDTLDKLASL